MPAIQRSEFALALNQVSNERGLDPEVVLETVRNAILAAYRKDHPEAELEEFTALLDANSGEAKIFHKKKDVTPPGFGRIAAQTAKQVILQKIREKEKEAIMSDFKLKIGTILNGMVLRFAGPNIIVDIGKTEAIMPPNEQIPNEKYHLNQRMAVYIVEIKEGLKGEEVVVSRAHTGLLEGLFKREVPEVAQGAVEIKQIVREPGNRSKVAVFSSQPGIDPVGSCVGQRGVRVQAIIAEFGGIEKIDIIQWQENIKNYIAQSLSPAKELKVEVDEKEKIANVKVAPEELPLAIGKEGQNVRLASKLTGYRIEIEGDKSLSKLPEAPSKTKEPKAQEEVSKVSEEEKPATTENTEKSTEAQKNLSVSESLSDLEVARETSVQEDVKPAEEVQAQTEEPPVGEAQSQTETQTTEKSQSENPKLKTDNKK
ncbi:MAG: transcription termination factor NusA [Candidatus Levybacteria bacterium CG10_big_fil_rev_8_21_14_0_10_35_13]|nr:MAG: transcription termination factor NusA [Candidatus Levybacteria bacterium CG10_big_fil_rev_8_21_14_0_10_35_13]